MLLFSIVLLSVAGLCQSVVVEQDEEDRAIDMVRQMIRNLTMEDPQTVNNVCNHRDNVAIMTQSYNAYY